MKTAELSRQAATLKSLIKRVGHDPSTRELEMQAHWARYLCVLTSGFVENVVRIVYGEYVRKNSYKSAIIRYTTKQLDGIQNPKSDRLVKVARAFDDGWGSSLEAFLSVHYRSDAINSIMSNRHLIAHGRSSAITVSQVSSYLAKIIEVAEFLEKECGL